MSNYVFTLRLDYTSDDPASPVSGPAEVTLVFTADSLASAKTQLIAALTAGTGAKPVVRVGRIPILSGKDITYPELSEQIDDLNPKPAKNALKATP